MCRILIFTGLFLCLTSLSGSAWSETNCPPCDCTTASQEKDRRSESWAILSVDSQPRGADVYIDSEYQGTTPIRGAKVHSGNVPVTLRKEGYRRLTTRIDTNPGEKRSLGVLTLESEYGEIYIQSIPPRADVSLDGKRINARTPVTIRRVSRDKSHTLHLKRDGYQEWERVITLENTDKKRFDVELEKQPRN